MHLSWGSPMYSSMQSRIKYVLLRKVKFFYLAMNIFSCIHVLKQQTHMNRQIELLVSAGLCEIDILFPIEMITKKKTPVIHQIPLGSPERNPSASSYNRGKSKIPPRTHPTPHQSIFSWSVGDRFPIKLFCHFYSTLPPHVRKAS